MTIGLMDRALALSPYSPAESARRGARDQRPCEPGGWLGDVLRGSDRNLGPSQTGFSNPVHGQAGVHLDPESIGGIQSGFLDAPPRDSSVRGDPGRLADVQRVATHRRDDDARVGGRIEVIGHIAGELNRCRIGGKGVQPEQDQQRNILCIQAAGHHDESPSTYG